MKKFLFLCLIAFAFVACKDEKEVDNPREQEPKAIYYVKYVMHYTPASLSDYKITMHMLMRDGDLKIRTEEASIEETTGPVPAGFQAKATYFASALGEQSVEILVGTADEPFARKAYTTKVGSESNPAVISYTIE